MRNRAVNGFFTDSARQLGTHTDKYFRELARRLKKAETETDVVNVLETLKTLAERGEF